MDATGDSAAFAIKDPATAKELQAIIEDMRSFQRGGATRRLGTRLAQLEAMRSWLKAHETEVLDALHADLGKSHQEGFETELGMVYDELRTMHRKLRCWMRPKPAVTPLAHFPATTMVYPEPFGVAAVLAPWNYPLQLSLIPAIDAIAAGNVVLMKPSKSAPHTGALLKRMVAETFDPRYVHCVFDLPNLDENMEKIDVDFMFFTGSPRVAKLIMHACADHLTPMVLELGGKSPVFVDETADLRRAGQRITWGKCLNSGQTCVAPDYVLAHESVVDGLVEQLRRSIHEYFGDDILHNEQYPHMVNRHHFDRVCGLIDDANPNANVVEGGGRDEASLRIEPTIMTGVTLDDAVMGQEIFGPVLPILTWRTLDEAMEITRNFGHPLACYVFSNDRDFQQRVVEGMPFGGGCVNDVVIHAATNHAGFGGVGNSGMGEYHGKRGFDAFTHYKTVVRRYNFCEPPVRSAPFEKWKLDLAKLVMR